MKDGIGEKTLDALRILKENGRMTTGQFMDSYGFDERKRRGSAVKPIRWFLLRLHRKGFVKAYIQEFDSFHRVWKWEISPLGNEILMEKECQ